MKIYHSCLEIPRSQASVTQSLVLALGNFDGFHLGHKALVQRLQNVAKLKNSALGLMTFEPHPREFLKKKPLPRIWGRWDLRACLKELGFDLLIEQNFDEGFANTSADDFLENYILPLQPTALVVGHDFAFGRNREGSLSLLSDFGKRNAIEISIVDAVDFMGSRVSTTQIKKLLEDTELLPAQNLLGHWPSLGGAVIHGQKRGRTIGVPTANLQLQIFPALARGVYGVEVEVITDRKLYKGVANLGINPTVTQTTHFKLETHLFDFSEDLYEREIRIYFKQYLRTEKKFSNIDELKTQIQLDLTLARGLQFEK